MKTSHYNHVVAGHEHLQYLLQTDTDKSIDLQFYHQLPHTSSQIDILIIAGGQADVHLDASVAVEPAASDVSTKLNLHVITSDNAKVSASPNLLINNNQVQASHSLSTIRLSQPEIYYLSSRGIDQQSAQQLLINQLLQEFAKAIRL